MLNVSLLENQMARLLHGALVQFFLFFFIYQISAFIVCAMFSVAVTYFKELFVFFLV